MFMERMKTQHEQTRSMELVQTTEQLVEHPSIRLELLCTKTNLTKLVLHSIIIVCYGTQERKGKAI